jgi:hypothetical protein
MANTFAPFGFRPIMNADGSAWTGNQSLKKIASNSSTALYYGDLVAILGTGYITVGAASATTAYGIFVGCRYVPSAFGYMRWSNFWPGSGQTTAAGDIDAYVIDAKNVVFEVQSTGSAALSIADVGVNLDLVSSSGSAITGMSTHAVNANSMATTATFPLRLWAVPGVNAAGSIPPSVSANMDAGSANNVVQVVWNQYVPNQLAGIN